MSSALAKNSALQVGGKLLGTLFGLVTFYLLLQYFGTAGYGLITTAITYVTIFGVIVDFGLTLTTTQMISEHGANEEKILGNLLALRVLTALVFLSIAPISAIFVPGVKDVLVLVSIITATTFFASVAQTFIGVFQKRLALGIPVLGEMLNRLVALVLIILVGTAHLGLAASAVAFTIGNFVQFALMLLGTARYVKLRPRLEWKVWREIIVRSWPIGVSIFFNLLYLKGDILFMAFFHRSFTEIGQYGSAYKVVDVMTMIPVTFMGLMLPLLSVAWSEKNREKFDRHLQQTFDIFAMIAIPFAVGSILLGVPVMTAVKPDLILAGQVLSVLGPASAVVFFNSLYGHAVVAVKRQRVMLLGYCFVAVVAILGYVLYIPLYGAWAAAWVTLISESLIGLCSFAVVASATRRWPNLLSLGRALIATAVMSASILLIPGLPILVELPLAIMVYALALVALGGPKPKHVMALFMPDKPSVEV
ncbi:MAG: flippase [Patescibacteria group bacterium]|jgi:O-antigen/teichoic acid export membrane protein